MLSISHVLYFKKGGLITSHRNKLLDGVIDLSRKALVPTHMRDDPLIHPGCAVQIVRAPLAGSSPPNNIPGMAEYFEQKCGLLIRYI